MRNEAQRTHSIFHHLGSLAELIGAVLVLPAVVVVLYWGERGDGVGTLGAFLLPGSACFLTGVLLRRWFRPEVLDMTGSMLLCALGWLVASAFGALPFVLGLGASYLDGYFEAMSGFTTTGITMFSGLDRMPHSLLFWRAFSQWLGGLGILSFFLAITFRGAGEHHVFGAESHKISSDRLAPGIFNTVRMLWRIYALFTVVSVALLSLEGMPVFDAVCHTFTGLSTGGYSPHDKSIGFYAATGHPHAALIEYTVVGVMLLGGINFLVHYRVLTGNPRALGDTLEMRYWWRLLAGFVGLILVALALGTDLGPSLASGPVGERLAALEDSFRTTLFQVVAILTTTGFATEDIGGAYFPALAKQLFLVMMVIGGCVGSTGGGIKVLRVAILTRLMGRELFRSRVSQRASTRLVIDGRLVSEDEVHRVACLFFAWIGLLVVGGGSTAVLSHQDAWASFSGMFSALGNIGPCYISQADMIAIHPGVKVTYIFGMLAGRLEILPVLLLFSRRAWR